MHVNMRVLGYKVKFDLKKWVHTLLMPVRTVIM